MQIDATIGIIGGNGWLGGAIARAITGSGLLAPGQLLASSRSGHASEADIPGIRRTTDNQELVDAADIVMLSVRPEQFPAITVDARGKLVVSVMAGVPAEAITQRTQATKVVRSIPNAAAAIGRSFTPWFATPPVCAREKELVQSLFGSCGEGAEVFCEAHVDYCAAMTGPGAALPALLAEALVAHAVKQGLPHEFATRAATGVVAQASQLIPTEPGGTAAIVQAMLDYDGMTAKALRTMLEQGFNEVVAAGLEAATR